MNKKLDKYTDAVLLYLGSAVIVCAAAILYYSQLPHLMWFIGGTIAWCLCLVIENDLWQRNSYGDPRWVLFANLLVGSSVGMIAANEPFLTIPGYWLVTFMFANIFLLILPLPGIYRFVFHWSPDVDPPRPS